MTLPTPERPWPVVEGDSFEVLRDLPADAFDHVISDPPYSAVTHKGARTQRKGAPESEKLIHFDPITDDQFVWLCEQFVRVAKRWVILTCDWRHAALAEAHLPESFVRLGVWVKNNGMPQLTGDRPATGWEAVLILHRKGRKRWNRGGHPAVWTTNIAANPVHPTQKPMALLRPWVRDFTDPGESVLDPFAGACSTALACAYEGRTCLSIERDAGFAAAGRKRLARLADPDSLVPYAPRRPADAPLF